MKTRYDLHMFSQPEQKLLEDNESTIDLELGDLDYSYLLPVSIGGESFSNNIESCPLT